MSEQGPRRIPRLAEVVSAEGYREAMSATSASFTFDEDRRMTYYCPVEVRSARMYEDPEPAEFCENEVSAEGLACNQHDDVDDDYAEMQYEERRLESRYGNDY